MKILPRTQFGNPILRAKAKKVSLNLLNKGKFRKLVKQMIYTMRQTGGVGLAAPQIGESLSLAVMETRPTPTRPKLKRKGPIVIINPRIVKYSKEKISDWEGCLSFENIRGSVPRSKTITVEYHNEKGEKIIEKAIGLWARIFQHEIDHLNDIVYIDRVEDTKTIMTLGEFKKRILKK
ncbi:MAG: peptide deformylase [Parcubacteria group bacterium]|nr:peptide deformylase [Parcubacteria group bacterium]